MNQRSIFRVVVILIFSLALTACGDKGLDGKLNFTLSDYKEVFAKNYDNALATATPEQQNVLREAMQLVTNKVVWLAANSNPATVEAFQAKKNTDEFNRLSEMSVRELVIDYLQERQNSLSGIVAELEKYHSGDTLKIEHEKITVDDIDPREIAEYTEKLDVLGTLVLRNDSHFFDYALDNYKLALFLDGKQVDEFKESSSTRDVGVRSSKIIKSDNGEQTLKYIYSINGKENVKVFYDLYKSGQMGRVDFGFKPGERGDLQINLSGDADPSWLETDDRHFEGYKTELQKVTNDLAILKK